VPLAILVDVRDENKEPVRLKARGEWGDWEVIWWIWRRRRQKTGNMKRGRRRGVRNGSKEKSNRRKGWTYKRTDLERRPPVEATNERDKCSKLTLHVGLYPAL